MTVFEIVVHRNVDNWIHDVNSISVKTVRTTIFAKNCNYTNTIFF